MSRPFKPGERVVITTVDLGGRLPARGTAKRPHRVETWQAIVVGPSVLGDDLWLVKRLGIGGRGGGPLTVPGNEMKRGKIGSREVQ